MIAPKSFLYEASEEGIATITLNRPERLNALTFETYAELRDTFGALQDEKNVRVVVITGKGKGFCSGVDLTSGVRRPAPGDPPRVSSASARGSRPCRRARPARS